MNRKLGNKGTKRSKGLKLLGPNYEGVKFEDLFRLRDIRLKKGDIVFVNLIGTIKVTCHVHDAT